MTIAFKPTPQVYEKYEDQVDKEVELVVVGYVEDEKGQAVLLEASLSENDAPHITLSCAEDTGPVYSNEMIRAAKADGSVQPASLALKSKVEFISFNK